MDVVGVCDITLIVDSLYDAKAALEALGEFIGGGLQGGAVEAEINVVLRLPLPAGGVHGLHDLEGEGRGGGVRVALSGHVLHALVKPGVAQGDGGIAAIEELVNGLPLFQAGAGAILPQDGGHVGGGALQALVAAQQGPVAQLQPLVKELPEFLDVPAGAQGHVGEIDGDHALVEPPVVLGFPGLRVHVGRQEAAAAHAGVAVALAVLVHLQFQHLLLGNIVGDHPLGGAFGRQLGEVPIGGVLPDVVLLQHIDQLGEGGGDPHAVLILHALVALLQGFLNNKGQVLALLLVLGLPQVHEDRDKGGLAVGGQEGQHLVLDGLHAAPDLFPETGFHQFGEAVRVQGDADFPHLFFHDAPEFLPAHVHKGGQVGQGDGLAAVLVGGHLGHDLGGDVAGGGEAVGPFNQGPGDDGAVLEHVLQVYQIAVVHVLGKVVGVMEVDDALLVGFHDVLGQQQPLAEVPGDLAGHIVPLGGVHHRVLVGILLFGLLVAALDEAEDTLVRGVAPADQGAGITVGDVVLRYLKSAVGHDLVFHQVLDFLYRGGTAQFLARQFHGFRDPPDLGGGHALFCADALVGTGDSR